MHKPPAAMQCVGLDIGSTSIKGAVLDLAGDRISNIVREPFPDPLPGLPARQFEIAPEAVLIAVRQVLQQLATAAPDADGLFCCGQMGGVILADSSGRARSNYLSWRDQRSLNDHPAGGSYLEQMRRRWSAEQLAELGELKAGSATSLLFWLAERHLLIPSSIPLSLGDFVVARLCQTRPRMERTQAVGLLNLRTTQWHHAALSRLGLDQLAWPALAEPGEAIGSLAWGQRRIPCYPVLGDQQSALLGAGLRDDELSLNISTGSQVSQITRTPQLGNYQTRCYFGGQFLNTITHLPAGRSLNVLVELLTELAGAEGRKLANPWPYIARVASESDGQGLACDLSFFAGPLGDRGRIEGITVDNLTVGNLFRSAFQNMADNYWECAGRLSPGRNWRGLVLSGGLTQSAPVLKQLIQRRFGVPSRECPEGEDTLLGLLRVGQSALAGQGPG